MSNLSDWRERAQFEGRDCLAKDMRAVLAKYPDINKIRIEVLLHQDGPDMEFFFHTEKHPLGIESWKSEPEIYGIAYSKMLHEAMLTMYETLTLTVAVFIDDGDLIYAR